MAFLGEVEHFRWDVESLEGGEKLEAFADVEPEIELPVNDQRWRFKFLGEQMRRPFPVKVAVLPRRAFKFPLGEPKFFRRAVSRLGVEHAVVRYDALEAIGVA